MIKIIAVGRMKDPRLADLIDELARRIRSMVPLEIIEIRDSDPATEASAMVRSLGSPAGHTVVVALDENGDELSSRAFADLLGRHGSLTFLIGGPHGLGQPALKRASRVLRLSAMTLTHEMARLLLTEQVFRGLSILRNRPYHR